jgi:hypothetical protein
MVAGKEVYGWGPSGTGKGDDGFRRHEKVVRARCRGVLRGEEGGDPLLSDAAAPHGSVVSRKILRFSEGLCDGVRIRGAGPVGSSNAESIEGPPGGAGLVARAPSGEATATEQRRGAVSRRVEASRGCSLA